MIDIPFNNIILFHFDVLPLLAACRHETRAVPAIDANTGHLSEVDESDSHHPGHPVFIRARLFRIADLVI